MPEINITGTPDKPAPSPSLPAYAQPATNLPSASNYTLAQLQAMESGAISGHAGTAATLSPMVSQTMANHAANSASATAAAVRPAAGGGGFAAPGAANGNNLTSAFVAALSTPIPGAPVGSVLGDLNRMNRSALSGGTAMGSVLSGLAWQRAVQTLPTIGIPGFPGAAPSPLGIPGFLQAQGNQPYPGGAGGSGGSGNGYGGGGGGFGSGLGGGYRGGGRGPIGAAGNILGFGASAGFTESLMGRAGPTAALVGAAIGAGYELYRAPQIIGGVESGFLGASQRYIDAKQSAYGMGRAIGASGDDLLGQVYNGTNLSPEWMQAAGINEQGSNAQLAALGVLPKTSGDILDVRRAMAGAQFMPGLSGMDPQQVAGLTGTMARYGQVQSTGNSVQQFNSQLSMMMENAVARGMDRTSLAQSLSSSISMSAMAGGGGSTYASQADFMMRFSGQPGGKTGEAGLSVAAGLNQAGNTIGVDPLRSNMAWSAASQLRSQSDVEKFLGGDNYAALMKQDGGPEAVQMLLKSVATGNAPAAIGWLDALTQGNSTAQAKIYTQSPVARSLYSALPDTQRDLSAADVMNTTPMRAIALRLNPQGLSNGTGLQAGQDNQNPLYGFDGSKQSEYRAGLLNMGVRADLVDTVLAQGKAKGVSPLLIGATMMNESTGGNTNLTTGAYGMDPRVNVMQIAGSSGLAKPQDATQSIEEGTSLLQSAISKGGDLFDISRSYAGPNVDPSYAVNLSRRMIQGGATGAIPLNMNRAIANAGSAGLRGSESEEQRLLEPSTAYLNKAANDTGTVFEKLTARLTKILKDLDALNVEAARGSPMYRNRTPQQ